MSVVSPVASTSTHRTAPHGFVTCRPSPHGRSQIILWLAQPSSAVRCSAQRVVAANDDGDQSRQDDEREPRVGADGRTNRDCDGSPMCGIWLADVHTHTRTFYTPKHKHTYKYSAVYMLCVLSSLLLLLKCTRPCQKRTRTSSCKWAARYERTGFTCVCVCVDVSVRHSDTCVLLAIVPLQFL